MDARFIRVRGTAGHGVASQMKTGTVEIAGGAGSVGRPEGGSVYVAGERLC